MAFFNLQAFGQGASDEAGTADRESESAVKRTVIEAGGFFGWCVFKTWQACLLFLPVSPLYRSIDMGPALITATLAILIVPYGLSMLFADTLSSKDGMTVAFASAWLALLVSAVCALAMPNAVVVQTILISLTMWGSHFAWQPYAVTLRALSLVGARSLVASALFMVLVFLADGVRLFFWIAPFFSLALLATSRRMADEDVVFATKAESRASIDLLFHNSIWNVWEAILQGVGIGFMFAAKLTVANHLAVVGASMLLVAAILIVGHRVFLEFSKTWLLVAFLAIFVPLMCLAPLEEGHLLAITGAALFTMGRLQQGIDMRERIKMPYLEIYHIARNHFIETALIFLGATATYHLFIPPDNNPTETIFVALIVYVVIVGALVYLHAVIRNYETFVVKDIERKKVPAVPKEDGAEKDSVEPAHAGDNRWLRKVNAVATDFELSKRQVEVLKLLSYGRNAEAISDKLFISRSTAKSHIYTIYKKLDVHTQQELIELVQDQEDV